MNGSGGQRDLEQAQMALFELTRGLKTVLHYNSWEKLESNLP